MYSYYQNVWRVQIIKSIKKLYRQSVKKNNPRSRRVAIFLVGSVVLVIGILVIRPGSLRADSQGALSPGTTANDNSVGSTAWSNTGNATTSNNTYASATIQEGTASNYLKATNFGFSIPAGSTINGISVDVERKDVETTDKVSIQDNAVRIVKGGVVGSTDRSSGTDWPTTDTYATYGSTSDTWGESWAASDINSTDFGYAISAQAIRSGGPPGSTEDAHIDHVRITVHYTPPPTTYDQSSYRFFNNNNGTDVGTVLANQDTTATAPAKDTPFRLRMTLHVGASAVAQSGQNFKLQFAKKGSGSCASPEFSYADVAGSSAIQYYDNAAAADGAALTTNANDPQHSAHTTRAQTYEEANDFTNSQSSIAAGEDGLWDFALVDATADYSENYCFKTVLSSGSDIDSYGVYPEITTAVLPDIDQSSYRWYENADSTDVGSAMASQDTPVVLTSTGQAFRLRTSLHANTNKLKTSGQSFKLQFTQKGTGTCASPEFSYTDVSPSAGYIRYNDNSAPSDGSVLTDNANDPAHSGHTNNNQTYEEANDFTNSQSSIAAGEDGLWDFALIDDSSPGDTRYCFRVVDSSGSTLNSYGVYPEINTYNPGGIGTIADIVDGSGDSVADPAFPLNAHTLSFDCESVSGTFASSSQQIRVRNYFTAEDWSLTLAATGGATASWSGGSTDYDFNDNSGSPGGCDDGGDSDSLAGQMSLDPSAGTLTPKSGCSSTGITKGSSSSFIEGTTDDLTILSGTTASDTDCYWDLTGIDVSQQIPGDQPAGSYSINLTLTLTVF